MRLSAGGLVAAALSAQPPAVEGDYIEDRSNHVYGCYCEWSGEGETGGKEATLAWRIRAGSFASVDLKGLKLAAVLRGETTLSRGAPPRSSILVLDRGAPLLQRKAGEGWLREQFAPLLGRVLAVHVADIFFYRDAARAEVRIGDLVKLAMRRAVLPEDALQGSIYWYDPFVPLREATLATTLSNLYSGAEFNHRWSREDPGTTGYFGTFVK